MSPVIAARHIPMSGVRVAWVRRNLAWYNREHHALRRRMVVPVQERPVPSSAVWSRSASTWTFVAW